MKGHQEIEAFFAFRSKTLEAFVHSAFIIL